MWLVVGGGAMLPTCDHSNGLKRFNQKFKKHLIRWDLNYINIGPVGQTKPGWNLREHL